ncbi:arylamine N-acetyltransferase [Paenibacillus sp. HB172176]|uniref:arylamine N-acetyltransferase family protein n=1 Tax=Paenibacillus sp. HB172176 TaxID=2493690 RepID=UPI00143AE93E|nr:arylamine N-acetyltransferase [Paenibacillus sp. HB172176]
MKSNETNDAHVSAYLERISFQGTPDLSADTLFKLQECHLHAVPYENLDILRGVPLSLDTEALLEKIVYRKRGGYCFELNALFGWLLRELGFKVSDHVARFWRDEVAPPPKRRHHVLKVVAEGNVYLCDVGVGGIVPRWPILIAEEAVQKQEGETYKLARDEEFGSMLCELKRGEWERIYSFTDEKQFPKDFIFPSFWCEHAEDSIFRKSAMLAIRTREGRNTVWGDEFRIFDEGGVQTFVPDSEGAYKQALLTYFGITLD